MSGGPVTVVKPAPAAALYRKPQPRPEEGLISRRGTRPMNAIIYYVSMIYWATGLMPFLRSIPDRAGHEEISMTWTTKMRWAAVHWVVDRTGVMH